MEDKKDTWVYILGYKVFIIAILLIMWLLFPFLRETGNPIIDMSNSVRRGFFAAIKNPFIYIVLIVIFLYKWREK